MKYFLERLSALALALVCLLAVPSCLSTQAETARDYGLGLDEDYGLGLDEAGEDAPEEADASGEEGNEAALALPPGPPEVVEALPPIECRSRFYRENAPKLSHASLSNGIDLVVYRDPSRPVKVLQIILKGGTVLADPAKPGLESFYLQLCAKGGLATPAAEWHPLLHRNGASLSTVLENDSSSMWLSAERSGFDACLEPFLDAFLRPAMRARDFVGMRAEIVGDLRARDGNGMNLDSLLRARAFWGHPYAIPPEGEASLSQEISLDDLKAWRRDKLGAERVAVVAVGDFDPEALWALLEKSLGTLPALGEAPGPPPRWLSDCELYTKNIGTARETWIAGAYAAPGPADADWPAFQVANTILSSLMFQILRHREGQIYGAWAFGRAERSPWASIRIWNTANPALVKAWIDEAVALLAAGQAPAFSGDPGSTADLSLSIESWKRLCVSQTYLGAEGALRIAGGLAGALVTTGDPAEYFRAADRIMAVSAEELVSVVNRWILPARVTWVATGSQMALSSMEADDWVAFRTKAGEEGE